MATTSLQGRFTVKHGAQGQLSIALESGPDMFILFQLRPGASIGNAQELTLEMNRQIAAVSAEAHELFTWIEAPGSDAKQ
jgi:hypothetical protein